jgi:CubicO group peptidase (beta-lactamase class C family)
MRKLTFILIVTCLFLTSILTAQEKKILDRLDGFDQYMEKILSDWNAPGVGVGIIYKDKLIFSKGYGYRDYGKKLPVTANTLFQIASNTKLFTATAIGFLVDEGLIEWDKPIKNFVHQIKFYNDELNNTVTIRDMLSHRTGISRHDMIWIKSDFTRKELFEKLKYLEPRQPLRQGFMYNNLMYVASGYILELLKQKTWEDFLKEKIFKPLGMNNSVFSISDMLKHPDYFVPYDEKRDTTILYQIPYYEDANAVGPAGSIISNINDLSKWLIAQMNGGKYEGTQVIPEDVIKATLTPAIPIDNSRDLQKGYLELLSPVYGMGRSVASYRGHLLTYHGGDLTGIHSRICFMPADSIGVIVFTIGNHTSPLRDIITYNIYEKLLGLDEIPWSQRKLTQLTEIKAFSKEGRKKAGMDQVPNTKPSHPLEDYAGQFENAAYGIINISLKDDSLKFDFHHIILPLKHYHYDRFDTPNDEIYGKWSLNYLTSPQGDVDNIVMSIGEGTETFTRKADASMTDPAVLAKYLGEYEYSGFRLKIVLKDDNKLIITIPGQPDYELLPYKKDKFRDKHSADLVLNFINENGVIKGFDLIDPSGVYRYKKILE